MGHTDALSGLEITITKISTMPSKESFRRLSHSKKKAGLRDDSSGSS